MPAPSHCALLFSNYHHHCLTTLPSARLASSSSFDGLVEIVRQYEANEMKKAMEEDAAPAVIPPVPMRRPNVMSIAHILCSDPAVTPSQATVERAYDASTPLSPLPVECNSMEVSSEYELPVSFEDMSVYLNYFDEDEVEVVQLYAPIQWDAGSPVLGWTPPDGSEDVVIGHEDLACPSPMSNSAFYRVPASEEPERIAAYKPTQPTCVKAKSKSSKHPPAQLPRTRVVLAPTQRTGVKSKSREHKAKSRVSCGYGKPPKGGIPPALARDVTKSHALRAEKERQCIRAAAVRAGEGRKPSVLQRASAQTEDDMSMTC
ncbi:uncharacterized protein EDB91DRAFT_1174283 [Suillus paluster]|uniref:uncharacterized protein n=1 Tax=Suillus paluster TaxID=48578 RepID=UPI001B86BFA2|nr:uncharacterized protein EDB91DRAFT_1174283 [Suillus paluster]KAG1722689.1 hypothetical protein EDB91DRAFT_1174283 [Suillus paluster]